MEIRQGKVSYDGKFIIIHGPHKYEFSVDRFKNELNLLGWIYHLQEKVWFSREMCRDLINMFNLIHHKPDDFKSC